MKYTNQVIILLILIPLNLYANCTNLLKLELERRLYNESHPIFSNEAQEERELRSSDFLNDLNHMLYIGLNIRKASVIDIMVPLNLRRALHALTNNIFYATTHSEWAKDLYNDLMIELYLSKNEEFIRNFEANHQVSKEIIIDVLLARSIDGGFSGIEKDISVLKSPLEPNRFYQHIKKGKYLLDKFFQDLDHGDLIHMLQLDLMIYIIKSEGINPQISFDLYKWFGKNIQAIRLETDILSPWNVFFDLDIELKGLTTPEIMNIKYSKYFGIDFNEIPNIAKEK